MTDIKIFALADTDPAWENGARWGVLKPCRHPYKPCAAAVAGITTDTLENAVRMIPKVEKLGAFDLQVRTTERVFTPDAARKELAAWSTPEWRERAHATTWPYFNEQREGE